MTTIELYRKHKAGQVSKNKFLYEVRKDANLPWVTNLTSYDDAVKILKNNRIISEAEIQENPKLAAKKMSLGEETDQERDVRRKEGDKEMDQTLLTFLKNLNSKSPTEHISQKIKDQEAEMIKKYGSLNEVDNNIPTDPAVDRVNPYFLKKGVQMLLDKEKELTNDSYIKALNKAALMLQKNPHAFDEEMFANAKDVEKADTKLETQEVKKANHKDKANEMKKVKVKALKEAAIGELKDYLKKKELINEDGHWYHQIGSEVHTPNGKGKVIEIVGGTLTVEMEDGKLVDVQINTADHFTQKAQEELPLSKPELDQRWKAFDDEVASGKNPYNRKPIGQEIPYEPENIQTLLARLKEFISKNKGDKDKMGKLKEAIKKLKEFVFIDPKNLKSKPIVGTSSATQTALTRAGLQPVPGTADAK